MLKLFAGFWACVFAGFALGLVIPAKIFLIGCLVFLTLVVGLFYLFHLGVRDFQGY